MNTVRHLIGCAWTGDPDIVRHNPANADDIAVVSPSGTESVVDDAITAAIP